MTEINNIQNELIEDFGLFDDQLSQYEYIIDIGKEMPAMPEHLKIEQNVVKGCQSTVWLHAEEKDGRINFIADSNTVITKGIIALLVKVLDLQKIDEVLNADLYFIDKINLRSHLSSQRSNGLSAMIKQMKLYALAFKTKTEAS